MARVERAVGLVFLLPTFVFPGGSRFHFADPNRNEYTVWPEAAVA